MKTIIFGLIRKAYTIYFKPIKTLKTLLKLYPNLSIYYQIKTQTLDILTLKEPEEGGIRPPPSTFFVISQPLLFFSR